MSLSVPNKLKPLLITLIVIVFQSCAIVEINGNAYSYLTDSELEHIMPFEKYPQYNAEFENANCFKLFEVDSSNIQMLLNTSKLTWLHIWNPYCGLSSCTNIKPYEDLLNRHKKDGLHLLFISSTYDLKYIVSTVQNSDFKQPVFVLKNEFYGKKLKKIRGKLHKDLIPVEMTTNSVFNDDYLFLHDSLVYVGSDINDSIIAIYSE